MVDWGLPEKVEETTVEIIKRLTGIDLTVCPKGLGKDKLVFSRPDLGHIWPIRGSKTAELTGVNLRILRPRIGQRWPEDGMRKYQLIFSQAPSAKKEKCCL